MHYKINHWQCVPALFIVLFFPFMAEINSQTNGIEISGSVINESHDVIEIGNVLILSPIDSSLIKGDLFYDGTFLLSDVSETVFILKNIGARL